MDDEGKNWKEKGRKEATATAIATDQAHTQFSLSSNSNLYSPTSNSLFFRVLKYTCTSAHYQLIETLLIKCVCVCINCEQKIERRRKLMVTEHNHCHHHHH